MDFARSNCFGCAVMMVAHFNPAKFQLLLAAVTQIPTSRAVSLTARNGTKLFASNDSGA